MSIKKGPVHAGKRIMDAAFSRRLMAIAMALLILASCIYGIIPAFAAANAVVIAVDGTVVQFPDVQPFVDGNGRTLAPARYIAEALGGTVTWDGASQTSTVTKGAIIVKITTGKSVITVNGTGVTMDTAAIIKDGRTFIPVRYLAEALGGMVSYNSVLKRIEISMQALSINEIIEQTYQNNLNQLSPIQQQHMKTAFWNI